MPRIIKQNGTREPFDENKLRAGLLRALEKRPVSIEAIESSINHIKHFLQATGEREVKSIAVGEKVMGEGIADYWKAASVNPWKTEAVYSAARVPPPEAANRTMRWCLLSKISLCKS